MTGRYAVRTGMELTKITPPEGVGINEKEVIVEEQADKYSSQAESQMA